MSFMAGIRQYLNEEEKLKSAPCGAEGEFTFKQKCYGNRPIFILFSETETGSAGAQPERDS